MDKLINNDNIARFF